MQVHVSVAASSKNEVWVRCIPAGPSVGFMPPFVSVKPDDFRRASVITLKPAIRYQFKTGQRDWPKT